MSFYTHPEQPLTSIFHKPALQPSTQVLVFIPGNPGLIDYYTTYLELVQKAYPTLEVFNISHAGFQTTDDFVSRGEQTAFEFYDLDFQVKHKVNIISELVNSKWRQDPTKVELFFLCHSVGSFVMQRVARALLQDSLLVAKMQIKFIGLICPTILDIKLLLSGVAFTRMFWLLPVIRIVLLLTSFLKLVLPDRKIESIIRYKLSHKTSGTTNDADSQANMKNSIVATHNLVLSQRIIRQALTLAEQEMEEISQHDEINDFFFKDMPIRHNVKVWSFFADADYWVHDNTRDAILAKYHDEDNKSVLFQLGDAGDITHSFCIDQNKRFAHITCAALDTFFDASLH